MAKSRAQLVQEWRKTNPPGLEDRPSMHEMIEETWSEKGSLKDLFAKVSENWKHPANGRDHGFGTTRMHSHLKTKEKQIGSSAPSKDALFTFYNRDTPVSRRMYQTAEKLIRAFDLSKPQELMFYRIMSAEADLFDLDQIQQLAQSLIDEPDAAGARKDLINSLHEHSGLSYGAVGKLSKLQATTIEHFLTGSGNIRNIDVAARVIKAYLPNILPASREKLRKTRKLALSALTGFSAHKTLADVIKLSAESAQPRHIMSLYLLGPSSIIGLSISKAANITGINKITLARIMAGERETSAENAQKIAGLFDGSEEQKQAIINTLKTKILSPKELLNEVKEGRMAFNIAAMKMRENAGLTIESMARPGLSKQTIINMESHRRPMRSGTAKIHADIFFDENERGQEYEWHISCALGFEPLSKSEVLQKLKAAEIDPETALKQLFGLSQKPMKGSGISSTSFSRAYNYRISPIAAQNIAEIVKCNPADLEILSINHRQTGNIADPKSYSSSHENGDLKHEIVSPKPTASSARAFPTHDDGGSFYERLTAGMG